MSAVRSPRDVVRRAAPVSCIARNVPERPPGGSRPRRARPARRRQSGVEKVRRKFRDEFCDSRRNPWCRCRSSQSVRQAVARRCAACAFEERSQIGGDASVTASGWRRRRHCGRRPTRPSSRGPKRDDEFGDGLRRRRPRTSRAGPSQRGRTLMKPTETDYGERQSNVEDLAARRWTFSYRRWAPTGRLRAGGHRMLWAREPSTTCSTSSGHALA